MLLLVGFLLGILSPNQGITMPSWPINLYLPIGFIGLLIAFAVHPPSLSEMTTRSLSKAQPGVLPVFLSRSQTKTFYNRIKDER